MYFLIMCGIAGLYNFGYKGLLATGQVSVVHKMTDRMVHRGPDATDVWADDQARCVLGHRRLSIIDVSDAGRQPMHWNNGEWSISFNGEIYNFQEIKSDLESRGGVFHGRTDTEVLLAGIAYWGESVFDHLDGMYAFAAFHHPSGELILARDPFGEKPLYYFQTPDGGLAFASELQCLEEVPGFSADISPDALSDILMFQYVGAPRTIYRDVYKLEPGHFMKVNGRDLQIRRHFRFEPGLHGFSSGSREDLVDELEDILVRSLRRRLISDVPLGAFLSGGVDSSTVCALARRKLDIPLQTFSIGFEGDQGSEHKIARRIAAHLGTEHRDQILSPSATDFLNHSGSLLDEPNADSSCLPTFLLSKFARKHVTVALSGDGGDELFGGYGRYFDTLTEAKAYQSQPRRNWSPGRSYYNSNRVTIFSPLQLSKLFGFIPSGSAEHVRHLIEEVDHGSAELLHRLRASDTENYMPGAVLPKVDRMSMQNSLEVRTPFLSVELARFAERIPGEYLVNGGRGKLLLREIAYRYLPREIIDLPKKGFGLPLTSGWGKHHLVSALENTLISEESPIGKWIGGGRASEFIKTQASDNGFSIYQTWSVIMLDKWLRNRPAILPERDSFASISAQDVPAYYSVDNGHLFRLIGFVAPRVLVISNPIANPPEEKTPIRNLLGSFDIVRLSLVEKAASIEASVTTDDLPDANTFRFDADQGIIDVISQLPFDLAGCTLISLDEDVELFGVNEIQYLRAQRLRRLIIPQRYDSKGNWVKYEFHYFNIVGRIVNLMHLLSRVKGMWRAVKNKSQQNGVYVAGPFESLTTEADRDAVLDWALFVGPSQYLPFISSHEEIRVSEAPRYSIWNDQVIYSLPRQTGRWFLRPFYRYNWLTPIHESTARYLPVVTSCLKISSQTGGFEGALRHLVDTSNLKLPARAETSFVALYTHALSSGGAERQWVNLAIGLKALGKQVCLIVNNCEGENAHYLPLVERAGIDVWQLEKEGKDSGVRLVRDELIYPLVEPRVYTGAESVQRLAVLLDRLKPDALVAQLDSTNITGAIAALMTNIPKIVMSFRNYNPSHFEYLNIPWFLPGYRYLAESNRVFLTGNSKLGNADYAEWIGIDGSRIKLLHNSYEPESKVSLSVEEGQVLRRSLGIEPDEKVILGAFRLSHEKDPLLFVDVCADVLNKLNDCVVLLCGEGPMRSAVEEEVRRNGIQNKFHMLGRRSDMWQLLSIADVLLLTSEMEGTPNIVREALMMRCPVVSTACGAVPEMIDDPVTGFISEIGDRHTLASKLLLLLENDAIRAKMKEAISVSKKHLTPRDMAIQLYEIMSPDII
ncbi:asparagine synthase (glutamine-hydrolyzing) [Halothiobacillus sp. DCM-1]|uniref:asparagine synthase (glutamine-hydrolyzing) n=1 Tax=Halothiobacillus sp. DCM-1 TaxID=3112558 RepID=UPI0032466136